MQRAYSATSAGTGMAGHAETNNTGLIGVLETGYTSHQMWASPQWTQG